MAPFYRRRRRYYRRYRRPFRPRFRRYRRYRRRRQVRRRRRRRGFKKRRYISSVMQWHPRHRALCTISGWFPAILCFPGMETQSALKYVKPFTSEDGKTKLPGHYRRLYGSVFLAHWSLDLMYREWLLWRNFWTVSNDSFDLARYFGTKIKFWPHENWPYIVWWETDYGYINWEHYQRCHPAIALLERNHMIILPRKYGRRKPKTLKLKPPAVHRTQWYFMKDWCDVGLFRLGISFMNFENPFMHRKEIAYSPEVSIGVGYFNEESINPNPPFNNNASWWQDPWIYKDLARQQPWRLIKYKWWWDDGIDNKYFFLPFKQEDTGDKYWRVDTTQLQNKTIKITYTDRPYWACFWGLTPEAIPYNHYVFLWWYSDNGRFNDIYDYKEDLDNWNGPQKTQYREKVLSDHWPNCDKGVGKTTDIPNKSWIILKPLEKGASFPALQSLLRQGPLVMNDADIGAKTSHSLFFQYKSYWQWGGVSPNPESVLDPCNIPPTSDDPRPIRVRNPRHVHETALHPWDIRADGFITKEKFRQLIGHTPETIAGHPDQLFEHPRRSKRDAEPPSSDEDSEASEESSIFTDSDQEAIPPTLYNKLQFLRKNIKRERNERHKLLKRIRTLTN